MSAEITQTASAGVCVSDRAWNFEERERREGGRMLERFSQPTPSIPSS